MKNNILLWIAILSLYCFNTYSQKAKIANADKKYSNYAYIDAIKTYERVNQKGYKSQEMLQKLGNAYYFNSELDKAEKWYSQLYELNQDLDPEYYYRYAQCLRSTGQNEKANEMIAKFSQKSENDNRGKLFKKDVNFLKTIKENSGRYKIEDAGINSKYSDYGSAINSEKLVFTSARDTGSLGQRKHQWTDQHFTNLYSSELGENWTPKAPKKYDKTINSKFNESTPIYTKDGKTVYFTRNNYIDGKKGKDGNNITLIKIYKATLENNTWAKLTALPFNSDNYSVAHPALSADEKTLYFASDMPGTLGQSDLFKIQINPDGSFGIPQNLGNTINTEGKETFPYVTNENEIYFSSDGHPGLGALDIFVSKINEDGTFDDVQNIGADANSSKDDFAYIIDTKTRRGFLSSNRDGGLGYDDIYKFIETRKLMCEQELYGIITDQASQEILPDSKVTLFDSKFNLLKSGLADANAKYSFTVQCGKSYYVRAEKEGYSTKEVKTNIPKENGKTNLPIALEKSTCKVEVGDDLGKCFGIKMIYFDLDKAVIRNEAALDLSKILDVLIQNPTMKLDIRSHTDCRASFKYNEKLSEKRAKATVFWLIKNGVDKNRLTSKGYGETQLVNKCADGVQCTEEEHQLNRRSEFIITNL
jgi:outer membrane protein OmpA-like peptidoglycan-associated protein/tetratricopeptide (TPR) repeat protein